MMERKITTGANLGLEPVSSGSLPRVLGKEPVQMKIRPLNKNRLENIHPDVEPTRSRKGHQHW